MFPNKFKTLAFQVQIIQWNILGIANKKAVLVHLIAKEEPDVPCIQETMLSKQTSFNLRNYSGLF